MPLSTNTGLISWLENCETLFQSIKNYRNLIGVYPDCERRLVDQFIHNYDILSKIRKVEIFRYVCDNTKAEDIKKIFWL